MVMLYVFTLDMGLKYVLYWSANYMFECCINGGYQMWSCYVFTLDMGL